MGMSGFYVGLSGLQTSSNSLNTTSNNLTNVNTEGYVRQQVVNKDMAYNRVGTTSTTNTGQRGLGVSIASVNHVRDVFLDAAYRKESGRNKFYDKMYDAVYEIETQMGDVDGIDGIKFQGSISDMLEAFNEVAKAPSSQVARSALIQSASEFISDAQSIYKGLADYQKTLNDEIISTVKRINELGDSIYDLNKRISKIEAGGYENAANLRDARDVYLDELAQYCRISYNEDDRGVVEVSVEGVPFADDLGVNHMGMKTADNSTFVTPYWPEMNNQEVYNMKLSISTEMNTDIGGLKGLVMARGEITPTYMNMEEPDPANYGGTADPSYLNALSEYNRYQECCDKSILVNTLANFDKLINGIVENVNNVLCPEKEITDAAGNTYTVLDMDNASRTEDGNYGIELFSRLYCDRYEKTTIDGQDYFVRNDANTFGKYTGYTIMELQVNDAVLKDYSQIPLTTDNGEDDYQKAKALVDIFDTDTLTYNGGKDGLTFEEFYETLINDVANNGSVYKSMADNEATLKAQLDSQRQTVMGVSSDEELSNMIRYQQAYNASSRYINVVSDMLATLINNLGA